ncbi:MAG TPA: sugar phosphate nucleotidyltransferase [Thermoanaerobaculia bacterium]
MKVAILCGGLGTRIAAIADGLPKAMIDVNGRPYLEYVIDSFRTAGLTDLVLLTGFRADVIEAHFGEGARFGVRIDYSREQTPLGTGGALLQARALLGERFLLTYGDVLRRYDYGRFVQEHPRHALAVYRRVTIGNTDVEAGLVTRYDKEAPELPYIDAGFSVFETEVLDLVPGQGSFEQHVFPELARRGELEAEIVDHDFYDIGTPEELARTRAALENNP